MPPAQTTKEQLVLTAERLFAVHGIEGVSLRQIGQAAGTANNSAVQYHFGSKDGLVQAIFEHRIPALMQRRRVLTAEAPADDLRRVVELYVRPMVELVETGEGYYATFLEQLQRYGLEDHPFARLSKDLQAPHHRWVRAVDRLLAHVPEPVRSIRINQAGAIALHASADRERALRHGTRVPPFALHVNELFDGIVGYLTAPVSEATLAAVAATSSTRARPRRALVP